MGNLVNQHVRFTESGEFLTYPKPTGGNSLDRLIERKQMSTKTTFKRIALVTVAALGFGGLSVVSAPVANAAAASFSVNTTSITVVGTPTVGRALAAFRFTVLDGTGTAANLGSTETLTVSIKQDGLPSAITGVRTPVVGDFTFKDVMDSVLLTSDSVTQSNANGLTTAALTDGAMTSTTGNCSAPGDGDRTGDYCQAVVATSTSQGLDWGYYTLTADLTVGTAVMQRTTLKFQVVSVPGNSGAVITVATAGTLVSGGLFVPTSTNYIRATLRDANGGLIVNVDTSTASSIAPALTATLATPATATAEESVNQSLIATDTGVAVFDYSPTAGATANDGVYGLTISTYQTPVSTSLSTTAASLVRVRYGLANSTGTISVLSAPSANPSKSSRSVTGTGLYTATETTTASNAQTYNVPLTTKDVTVKITAKNNSGDAIANTPLTFTTTWSGVNSGDVTPVSGATGAKIVYTNSLGEASVTVSQANALTGSTAAIAIAGASATNAAFGTVTIAWLAPVATTLSVTTPGATFKALAASTVSIVVKAKDQFDNGVAGVVIQPALSSTSANYTTAAKPTLVTGADGTVTMTYTAGAAATSDAWTFSAPGVTSATRSASYVAALPVVSTLTGYYNADETAGTYPNLFSSTAIGATTAQLIEKGLNYGATIASVTGNTTDTRNEFRIQALDSAGAAVTGIPVTISVTAGGHMLDTCSAATAAKAVTSMTCYPNTDGYVFVRTIATGTGTITYTATAGAVTATQSINAGNASTDARTLKLVATGADVVASVVDRFGNGVADQSVQITVSGGSLTGGSKIATYTTDSKGNFGFGVEGDTTVTVTGRLATANDSESVAGKTGTTTIDSTVAAGVRTATVSVTAPNTTTSTVAQAAADAAAEATDAANAATDAANAAAEAADAATAAAQDAADAVAALSTQVSEMVNALKKQITALTNLVIKIQKKVKA